MGDLCMYHTFFPVVANIRSQDSFSGNPMTVFSFLFSDAFFSGWFRIFASPVRGSPLALQPSVADCCVTPQIATTFNTAHRTGTMACRAAPAGERTSESGRAVGPRSRRATPRVVESPLRLTTGDHRGFIGGVCARRGVARGCWRFARASRLRVSLANTRPMRDDTTSRPEDRQA